MSILAPYAAAFKPNAAFFEALGPNLGINTLRRVIDSIPSSIPVLLDVKRGDIGTTAQAYAEACYEREPLRGLGADVSVYSKMIVLSLPIHSSHTPSSRGSYSSGCYVESSHGL